MEATVYGYPFLGVHRHAIPDLQVLKLGDDPIRVADVTADQVFEKLIAMETTPSLSYCTSHGQISAAGLGW